MQCSEKCRYRVGVGLSDTPKRAFGKIFSQLLKEIEFRPLPITVENPVLG